MHPNQRVRDQYLGSHIQDAHERICAQSDLARIVREGIAFASNDVTPDLGGVAVPVFHNEKQVAAIAVAGPTARICSRLDEIAHAAIKEAHRVTERLASM